jgi:ComF family protein
VHQHLLSNFLNLAIDMCPFFSQPCLLCGTLSATNGFCQGCRQSLLRLPQPHCPRCALPLQEASLCGRCQRHPPAFDALHVPYVFCYPLSELIYRFKYGKRLELAGALGCLLQENSPKIPLDIDVLIPVPLSKERLAERGFNQSDELARAVAGIMPDRFQSALCGRKRNTFPQAHLKLRERRRNLLDAFCVETSLDGLSVAIVDDVVTTGSTLDALAKTLKNRGAIRVEAWALARTLVFNT